MRQFVLVAVPALAAPALAGPVYTTVNQPIYPGEFNHAQILDEVFSGDFVFDGVNLTNGDLTANRLADAGADGIVDLLTGNSTGPADIFWGDGDGVELQLEAKFAADTSTFGWIDGAAGGDFNPLIETGEIGDSVFAFLTDEFRWALDDSTTDMILTSNPADQMLNDEPVDQMVAYHITGLGGDANTWVLFFEDRIDGDYDFNDAVLQVTVVPAPGAIALFGLGGLVIARRRR